jgi:NTP pyrophosphatase (non-canonical NTP hydrolase)
MSEERKRFPAILEHRSRDEQLLQVCEELGELLVSISQHRRGRVTKEAVATEIADVELQLEWLLDLFGISAEELQAARDAQRLKFRTAAAEKYGYAEAKEPPSDEEVLKSGLPQALASHAWYLTSAYLRLGTLEQGTVIWMLLGPDFGREVCALNDDKRDSAFFKRMVATQRLDALWDQVAKRSEWLRSQFPNNPYRKSQNEEEGSGHDTGRDSH